MIEFHREQEYFVRSRKYYSAFIGGIGSGKTFGGSVRAVLASNGLIGNRPMFTAPNLGVITAPTYSMLRDATIRTFQDVAGPSIINFNKSEMLATMANGSEILFRSTDNPERLRGPSISWWWGDEAALYTPDVWNIMLGRLRQFGKRGYAWLTTTPKGRNWVWQKFIRDGTKDHELFRSKSEENTFLDASIVESWRQAYVGDFAAQELDAEFISFEGLIYYMFDRNLHVRSSAPTQFDRVIAGVDWGFSNPGVILVFGVDGDGRMWGLAEEYQRQRGIDEWVNVARQLRDTFGIKNFVCDPSEPDYIKKFQDGGLKAEAANNTVSTGIQAVMARYIKQGDGLPRLILSPNMPNCINEAEQYQWAENKYGIKDEPVKANDHAMDAQRYAVMHLDHSRMQKLTATVKRWA